MSTEIILGHALLELMSADQDVDAGAVVDAKRRSKLGFGFRNVSHTLLRFQLEGYGTVSWRYLTSVRSTYQVSEHE